MNKNDCLYEDILKREIVIPDVVYEKANDAFAQLKTNAECRKDSNMEKRRFFNVNVKVVAAFLILVLCGGGITAFAAYMHWSESIKENMNVTENQIEQLRENNEGLNSNPGVYEEQRDIKVRIAQCLAAYKDIRLSVYIDGYNVERNGVPVIGNFKIYIEDEPIGDCCWETENAGDNRVELYATARLQNKNVDAINKKKAKIVIKDIGEYEGEWNLEWQIEGVEKTEDYILNEILGDSGATLERVRLSPISAEIQFDYDYMTEGENYETTEPPKLYGVKLEDGTICEVFGGGYSGYINRESGKYINEMSFSRIIEIDKVRALLFLNDEKTDDKEELSEEECYVVGINLSKQIQL